MSTVKVNLDDCYDFVNHCDETCSRITDPYMNRIQRALSAEHGHNTYYKIPIVIQSICNAYYCEHIEYRLSFKSLFTSFPTHQHFLSEQHNNECKYNWKQCLSIERMCHILKNYQQYLLNKETGALSPFVTYNYYGIKEILYDMNHINNIHPQNTVKFYIMRAVIGDESKEAQCNDECIDHNDNINCKETINDIEEWIKYTICRCHSEYIHHSLSVKQFEDAVAHIVIYNSNVFNLLSVLRNVSKKLAKFDDKYRTLDTTNPLVEERLLGFEGVVDFLSLLGFESNAMGTKLICQYPPTLKLIQNGIETVDAYNPEIRPSINTSINQIPPINHIKESKKQRLTKRIKGFKHIRIRSMYKEDAKQLMSSIKRKLIASNNMNAMDVMNIDKDKNKKKMMHWIGHKFKRNK